MSHVVSGYTFETLLGHVYSALVEYCEKKGCVHTVVPSDTRTQAPYMGVRVNIAFLYFESFFSFFKSFFSFFESLCTSDMCTVLSTERGKNYIMLHKALVSKYC